jgi:tryptophanyl-tRNA synthetase
MSASACRAEKPFGILTLEGTHQPPFSRGDQNPVCIPLLTTHYRPAQIAHAAEHNCELVLDDLSIGIDPEKTIIYVQFQISRVSEIQTIFSILVTVAQVRRIPTLKEVMAAQGVAHPSLGLPSYPVLQAVDILLMRAHTVPVGQDQASHIELFRRSSADRLGRRWQRRAHASSVLCGPVRVRKIRSTRMCVMWSRSSGLTP